MAPLFLAAAIGCLAAASTPARPAFGAVSPHWMGEGRTIAAPSPRWAPRRATRAALFDATRRAELAKLLGHGSVPVAWSFQLSTIGVKGQGTNLLPSTARLVAWIARFN